MGDQNANCLHRSKVWRGALKRVWLWEWGQTLWFDQLILKDADTIARYDFYGQSMFILLWCNGEVQIILTRSENF